MRTTPDSDAILHAGERLIAIVGNYGSGKTELAVNLSLQLAADGHQIQIADLDLVNPYFRCREVRELMEASGIRVVVPPGVQVFADLPIVLPEIRGMLRPPTGTVSIFDVGGDDVGARALASFRTSVADGEYELWQVINARRPFTDSVAGCLAMRRSIESASRWNVTGLVVNTHLIEDTTVDVVMDGWRLSADVRAATGLPIRAVAVMDNLAGALDCRVIDAPLLPLHRHMLPPWLATAQAARPAPDASPLPAPRPVPIGKPRPVSYTTAHFPEGDPHGSNRY